MMFRLSSKVLFSRCLLIPCALLLLSPMCGGVLLVTILPHQLWLALAGG